MPFHATRIPLAALASGRLTREMESESDLERLNLTQLRQVSGPQPVPCRVHAQVDLCVEKQTAQGAPYFELRLADAGMRGGEDALSAARLGVFGIWAQAAEVKPLFEYVVVSGIQVTVHVCNPIGSRQSTGLFPAYAYGFTPPASPIGSSLMNRASAGS